MWGHSFLPADVWVGIDSNNIWGRGIVLRILHPTANTIDEDPGQRVGIPKLLGQRLPNDNTSRNSRVLRVSFRHRMVLAATHI